MNDSVLFVIARQPCLTNQFSVSDRAYSDGGARHEGLGGGGAKIELTGKFEENNTVVAIGKMLKQ